MAKKQTRRGVSLNRTVYDSAKRIAADRGMTLAGLVELALREQGVDVPEYPQQTPAQVAAHPRAVRERVSVCRPGLIRRMLGDGIANAMGEP